MELIPLKYYFLFFINVAFVVITFTLLHTLILKGDEKKVYAYNNVIGIISFITIVLFIGLRPLSEYYFVDMATYAYDYQRYIGGMPLPKEGDFAFNVLTYLSSKILSQEAYFFICAVLYISPLFIACVRWFPKYYFFVFIMLITSFSFYPYGVNGIRNGMATSFFILALSFEKKKVGLIFWLVISCLFHKSMLLPTICYLATYFNNNSKNYFIIWLASIFLSLTTGSLWVQLFASLGFGGERFNTYLNAAPQVGKFSSTGFRFDFLIYSAIPIIMGYLYLNKFNYKNENYNRILNTYLLSNAFWVMVIKANFSNRFAYLSWFIMAIVIFYPLFKSYIWENQFRKNGYVMLGYFLITYILTVILK